MDERKALVLRAVVEEYIETALPVGSQTIARSRGLGVSSATIRNDMTVLEREGYLAQPHTSAGRVPTDLGYRYFVDNFGQPGALAAPKRRAVSDFFATTHHALEDLLHDTSQLLAKITDHAAVVVGPQQETATVRSVQLVALHPTQVLIVAVLSNGSVESEPMPIDVEVDDVTVEAATKALQQVVGSGHSELPALEPTGNKVADALAACARDALDSRARTPNSEPLYVGGASHLAAEQEAFTAAASAARLLEMLERQVVVVSLVRGLLEEGVTVRIGRENEVEELRECSLVVAPYAVEGELLGTVGILGPTRMDYRQAFAAVDAVSRQLGRALS